MGTRWLTPLARRIALRSDLLDRADGLRKLHARPVPLLGGVAILLTLAAAATLLTFFPAVAGNSTNRLVGTLMLSVAMIGWLGYMDDLFGLRVRWKLLGQFIAAMVPVACGYQIDRIALFDISLELGWLSVPVSLAWYVTCMNAFNFIDGADGLASTVGIVTASGIAMVALLCGHLAVALLAVSLSGALLGFLKYNRAPASIYLGDAGSLLLGHAAALLALEACRKPDSAVSPAVLTALLAMPLLDLTLAVLRRTLNGGLFWVADRSHIHHLLLARGVSVARLAQAMGALAALGSLTAVVACYWNRQAVVVVCLLLVLPLLVRGGWVAHGEWQLIKNSLVRLGLLLGSQVLRGGFLHSLPSNDELSKQPLSTSTQALWNVLQSLGATGLELRVGDHRRRDWRRDWGPHAEQPLHGDTWALHAIFFLPGSRWCQVHVQMQKSPLASPRAWVAVLDVVRHVGQHWAAHPEQLAGKVLRLGEYASLAAIRPPHFSLEEAVANLPGPSGR